VKLRTSLVAVLLLALSACGSLPTNAVARYDSAVLSRQDLDARVARVQKGLQAQAAQGGALPSALEIEQQLVEQFLHEQLVLAVARQHQLEVSDGEVTARIDEFQQTIPQQTGTSLDETVQSRLGLAGASSSEFRVFVSSLIAQTKLSETLVTTDTVRTRITDEVMTQAKQEVEKADVAHILFVVEKPEDDAAAKAKAEDVIKRLNAGEDFATLAKELSEDPGSKDNGGVYEGITRGQFVPEFEKVMFDELQPGETTQTPVKTQFGYHVIRLIKREKGPALTDEQAQQEIEQRLPSELQQARAEALNQLLEDERAKALKENRIQEPAYPTATVPAAPAPGGTTSETPVAPAPAP
jgi:parvulin-like peptidyl-prolyl isomerase